MNNVFFALSDPSRRQMLRMLKNKDMNAGDISKEFNMSKPSISQHLKVLKEANLVTSEKLGQNVVYSLNTTVFQEIIEWFFEFKSRSDENEEK